MNRKKKASHLPNLFLLRYLHALKLAGKGKLIIRVLILLDAIVNPISYLNKLKKFHESNEEKNEVNSTSNSEVYLLEGLKLLVYAMAKAAYDGLSQLEDENPIFIDKPAFSNYSLPIPVLLPTKRDNDIEKLEFSKTLWGQFSHIMFIKARFTLKRRESLKRKTREKVNRARITHPKIGVKFRFISPFLPSYFDKIAVLHAKLWLPIRSDIIRIEWKKDYLGSVFKLDGFIGEFVSDIKSNEGISVMLMLIGPYGTGKTTTALLVSYALLREIKDNWYALYYDTRTDSLAFDRINPSTINKLQSYELSRALRIPRISSKLVFIKSIERASVLINLSELNASHKIDKDILENIENLIREIKEKMNPRRLVIIISAQTSHLLLNYKQYLESKPDMIIGGARLDYIHICRLDVPQFIEFEGKGKITSKTKYKFLIRLINAIEGKEEIDKKFGLNAENLVGFLLLKTENKIKLLQKIADEINYDKKTSGKIRDILGFIKKIAVEDKGEVNIRNYVAEWVASDKYFELFKFGIGTYSTVSLFLTNGFIRQTINAINNEIEFMSTLRRIIEHHRTGRRRKSGEEYLVAELASKFYILSRIIDHGKNWIFYRANELLDLYSPSFKDPKNKKSKNLHSGLLPSNGIFDFAIRVGDFNILGDITTDPRGYPERILKKIKKVSMPLGVDKKKAILINIVFDEKLLCNKTQKKHKEIEKVLDKHCKLLKLIKFIEEDQVDKTLNIHISLLPDMLKFLLDVINLFVKKREDSARDLHKSKTNEEEKKPKIAFVDVCVGMYDLKIRRLCIVIPIEGIKGETSSAHESNEDTRLDNKNNALKARSSASSTGVSSNYSRLSRNLLIDGRYFTEIGQKIYIVPSSIVTFTVIEIGRTKDTKGEHKREHHIGRIDLLCNIFKEYLSKHKEKLLEDLSKSSRKVREISLRDLALFQLFELCLQNTSCNCIKIEDKQLNDLIENIRTRISQEIAKKIINYLGAKQIDTEILRRLGYERIIDSLKEMLCFSSHRE